MTAHAVVFLNHPPAVLNRLLLIGRVVEERRRDVRAVRADAPQEKRRERSLPFVFQERLGHPKMLARVFLLAAVVDAWVCDLVLEETLVVVPGHGRFLARALRSRVRVGVGG